MAIKDQVDSILAARKQKAAKLEERRQELQQLSKTLVEEYNDLRFKTKQITDGNLKKQYGSIIGSINIGDLQNTINNLVDDLEQGVTRFNRDYISVATIGKERQGKSRFLQSVGNLDNDIIPAYDAASCTGATSVIWNDPTMPAGTVRAEITFRRQEDLVELVKPYIQELDPEYLQQNTVTFDSISTLPVMTFEFGMREGDADQATALKHLYDIVDHFYEIRKLFGAPKLITSDAEIIKTYVAQNDGTGSDAPESHFYNYLAVARADIYCPFYTDVGKIRLVDTVGLGATQFGIEQDMLDTVDRECDAAIVVTLPVSGVQEIDIALYNSLRNRFVKRDTKLWLFYLVNLHKGMNDKVVGTFCNDVINDKWSVAGCSIVDTSNQDQVRDEFLNPMLQTLLNNMEAIDGAYLEELAEKEKALTVKVQAFLEKMPDIDSEVNTSDEIAQEAYKQGAECFNKMSADLSNIVYHWSLEKNKKNSALWNNVQHILNDLENIIPSEEQINEISAKSGALLGDDIWATMLHYIRNEITDRFVAIDDVLEEETRQFKNSLVRVLYEQLRALTSSGDAPQDEDVDMVEWLKKMMDDVLGDDEEFIQIRKSFDFLYKFTFNTRAQLIQTVRQQMYIINPICVEYAKPEMNFVKQDCGFAIRFYLTSRMSVIEDELRYHLASLYNTPNQAFYAAAEEFYDRLTFASDISGDYVISMSHVWGSFFQKFSSRIWKENVQKYEAVKEMKASCSRMAETLNSYLSAAASGRKE